MKKIVFAILFIAASAFAATPTLFDRYEAVRQALLKNDVAAVQSTARDLAVAAKSGPVATHANQLAGVKNIKDARAAFAVLSQDLVTYRKNLNAAAPVVLYCSMEKKSWLQPSAAPVTNPYLDGSMRACGQVVK